MVADVKSIRHAHPSSIQARASLSDILEWLWNLAVGPILDHFGYKDTPQGEWPRLWWIPTGPLTLLPLHAAGYHSLTLNNLALDRVVSSYCLSIKALQYSRSMLQNNSKSVIDRSALLISRPTTPGQSALRFAEEEVEELDKLLLHNIERTKLSLPTTQEVVNDLTNCSIFIFLPTENRIWSIHRIACFLPAIKGTTR
ncbi:hypothetical protein QL093DRAFT_1454350 [Fusarium oxysporum]|nr:hypothetical protein QL093DRAFT_1454350 [Fusarium oxysporum]